MKREFLKELGLSDEQIDKVMAEHGKSVNSVKDELEKVKEFKQQVEELQGQLKERDKQLEELSKKAQGNEELTAEINKLKEANEKAVKEYEEKLKKQAFDFALERALVNAKAKNPKAVKALLEIEKISLDGENLIGLEEQLKALKEKESYLFAEEQPAEQQKPTFTTGQHQTQGNNNDPFAAKLAKYQQN